MSRNSSLTKPSPRGQDDALRVESRPTPVFSLIVGGALSLLIVTIAGAISVVQVDQILKVSGELKTRRSTQEIKTAEPGEVTQVLVKEAQAVKAGEPLVVLNPRVLQSRSVAQRERNSSLLVQGRAELVRLQRQIEASRAARAGLESQLAITEEQLRRTDALMKEGAAPYFQVLDYQKTASQLRAQIDQSRQEELRAVAESQQKQAEMAGEEATLRADAIETQEKLRQVVLRAPVNGSVLDLQAKTGLVVGAGEALLRIVPSDNLQARVEVPNADLAFVREGQTAKVSVQAYDRNKYGTIDATVKTISRDAVEAKAAGETPKFPVTLLLARQTLLHEGKQYELQPGMAVSADLKLDRRSILDLLMSRFTNGADALRTIR
ncbi:MAG: HlyD family secretion protein [Synechococcus sp. Tobar2m-G35]|jgi:hemolysin D|nr:HlyD family secretion protein [Synechococcus sp. Tobar2m-G35]